MIGVNGKKGGILYYSPTANQYVKIGKAWRANAADSYDVVYTSGYLNYVTGSLPLELKYSKGKPLVNWSITGNTVQEWIPSPEKERTANLCRGVVSDIEDNLCITFDYKDGIQEYTLSLHSATIFNDDSVYLWDSQNNKSFYMGRSTSRSDGNLIMTLSFDDDMVNAIKANPDIYITLYKDKAGTISADSVMLNTGSTALPYEPYGYRDKTGPCEVKMVGEKTENLLRLKDVSSTYGGILSSCVNGVISVDGTVTSGQNVSGALIDKLPQGTYTFAFILLSGNISKNINGSVNLYSEKGTRYMGTYGISSSPITFTSDSDLISFSVNANVGMIFDNAKFAIMINSGSAPLPYEPYGYKVPVVTKGKNLFDANKYYGSVTTVSDNSFTGRVVDFHRININDCFEIGKTYTFSCYATCPAETTFVRLEAEQNGEFKRSNVIKSGESGFMSMTFIPQNGCVIRITYGSGSTGMATYSNIQLELGSTATPFEPYHPPITTNLYLPTPLANGEVLRSTGERDVKWGVIKASTLNWVKRADSRDYTYLAPLIGIEYNPDLFACNKYKLTRNIFAQMDDFSIRGTTTGSTICIRDSRFPNVGDFIESLNDCYIYYTLATPTTEAVDMPAIPTISGTTVIDVDTEVKPESMTATYKSSKPDTAMTEYLELLKEV